MTDIGSDARRGGQAKVRRRWGADVPADAADARSRLLDAAERCLSDVGIAKMTVEAVADEAAVSRATVYRYFDGRDSLLLGVLVREGRRFMDTLEHLFEQIPSPPDLLVEVVAATVEGVRADRHLALLFAPGSAGLTMAVPGVYARIHRVADRTLRGILRRADDHGLLPEGVDIGEAAEFALRLTLSLIEIDDIDHARHGDDLRGFLRRFLLPALFVPTHDGRSRGLGSMRPLH